MFRQVVSFRWKPEVTDEQKAAFAATFAGLRAIPELISSRFGPDARHFDGNYDIVAVMDFPDFPAARRYVAHELHQAYVREFASQLVAERVIVQHDWAVGDLVGVQRVVVPVSDVEGSSDWYSAAFGLERVGGIETVVLRHPDQPIELALVPDRERAAALSGFPLITLSVGTEADLVAFVSRLAVHGIAHGAPSGSPRAVDVPDLDGIVVRVTALM